jgi:hypothetical protein
MIESATLPTADAVALLRATAREHLEGDPVLLQDIQRHLSALRLQAARVQSPTLRRLMDIEIGCVKTVLRGFSIVRVDPVGTLATAQRALDEVRARCSRGEYAEAAGYGRSALEDLVQNLGGAQRPPLSASS